MRVRLHEARDAHMWVRRNAPARSKAEQLRHECHAIRHALRVSLDHVLFQPRRAERHEAVHLMGRGAPPRQTWGEAEELGRRRGRYGETARMAGVVYTSCMHSSRRGARLQVVPQVPQAQPLFATQPRHRACRHTKPVVSVCACNIACRQYTGVH